MTYFAGNRPAVVAFASPVLHPPSRRHSSRIAGPPALWIAPSTPPPPSSELFAALTIASTRCSVMSPSTSSMPIVIDAMIRGPREDSNPCARVRSPVLFRLSYGGEVLLGKLVTRLERDLEHDVEHRVRDHQERGRDEAHADQLRRLEPRECVAHDGRGLYEQVPAVPAQVPAEVDAEARRRQRAERHDPPRDSSGRALRDALDEIERHEPEHQPRPRERRQQRHVEPDRHVLDVAQQDEVGDEVRRIRQKEEPERERYHEEWAGDFAPDPVVDDERERQRHPRQHQVPDEVRVVAVAAEDEAQDDEADCEKRRGGEDAKRGDPASARARPSGTHDGECTGAEPTVRGRDLPTAPPGSTRATSS